MREIKFRTWDKKYHMMEHDYSSDLLIGMDGKVYQKEERNYAGTSFVEYEIVNHYEIMQYTGLNDQNGIEIFEGDIVSGESLETSLLKHWGKDVAKKIECYEIKFVRGSFRLCNMKTNDWVAVIDHSGMSKAKDLIVIGNIYENKDLLETK